MTKRLHLRTVGLVAVVLLMLAALTNIGFSQQSGNGFRISPVRVEKTINKGGSSSETITIENPTPIDINARILFHDFEPAADESGQPRVILEENKSSSGNSFRTIVTKIDDIFIPAKSKKDVKVLINVPSNASSGGYYGAFRVIPINVGDPSKNVSLSASVGTLFLITVPGNITEQLALKDFSAAKEGSTGRLFVNASKLQIITRLENTGNIHVKPFGKIQITKGGKVVEEYEFNNTEPRSNVLPKSIRKFEDKLKNEKWFGKYKITANLGYGSTGGLITATNTFWVVPMWLIIVVVVALILLLVLAYWLYRKFTRTRKHKIKARR